VCIIANFLLVGAHRISDDIDSNFATARPMFVRKSHAIRRLHVMLLYAVAGDAFYDRPSGRFRRAPSLFLNYRGDSVASGRLSTFQIAIDPTRAAHCSALVWLSILSPRVGRLVASAGCRHFRIRLPLHASVAFARHC
jgi:hypothetical protein